MNSYKLFSDKLKGLLELDDDPIAIFLSPSRPSCVKRVNEPMPACSMWGKAKKEVLYAVGKDHYPCPVGVEVLGFELTPGRKAAKEKVYARLKEFGIRTQEAIARIGERTPKIPVGKINNIMYGPLKSAQTDPDVVLLICDPDQAMKLAEASGREDGAAPHALLNMPACATVSSIYLSGKPAVTLACHGSRKLVPIKTERLLFGIPGKQLATFLKNLERVIEGRRRLEESTMQRRGVQHSER